MVEKVMRVQLPQPKSVGKYTYISTSMKIISWDPTAEVHIGKFCSISSDLTIFLGGNHNSQWATTYPFGHINQSIFTKCSGKGHPKLTGGVNIGNDVWIGAGVTIMGGVNIGDGAIIANNSHVVRDVAPYTVAGGNPAKFLYHRFTPEITQKLLEVKWWDLQDDVINELSPLLCSNRFGELFKEIEKVKNA